MLGVLPRLKPPLGRTTMRTHDLENHDNLYADEIAAVAGETPADATSHALWAVALIATMVVVLGASLAVF